MQTTPKSTIIASAVSNPTVQDHIYDTVNLANTTVCSTLGPGGSNVLIKTDQGGKITKDGISVLMSIMPENPYQNAILSVIKDACLKTNKNAGDGTTSTVALIADIMTKASSGRKNLNGIQIRAGLMLAAEEIVKYLKSQSTEIANLTTEQGKTQLTQIANIATNGDNELSDMIVEIFQKVGKNAKIKLDFSNTTESEYSLTDGFQLNKGYLSAYFADDSGVITLNNPDIYVSEKAVASLPELTPVINAHMQMDKPFIIIAPKFELSVLNALVMYKTRGLKVCCVLLSEIGGNTQDILLDIAIATGAQLISEQTNISFRTTDVVVPGTAKQVIIENNKTTIISGVGDKDKISNRIENIKSQLQKTTHSDYKATLQQRLDNLEGDMALISIGGNTSARSHERYDLAEDAINACKAALRGGYLPGAGSALVQCMFAKSLALKSTEFNKHNSESYQTSPFNVFFNDLIQKHGRDSALVYGAELLFDACGVISFLVITKMLSLIKAFELQNELFNTNMSHKSANANDEFNFTNYTFDLKNDCVADALSLGVIDPTEVIINEVINAAEAAGNLLTMNTIIVNPNKNDINIADIITN